MKNFQRNYSLKLTNCVWLVETRVYYAPINVFPLTEGGGGGSGNPGEFDHISQPKGGKLV